jgi:uncharacterized protein (UPF0548 family)
MSVVDVKPLAPDRLAELRARRLTYPEVGRTADENLPAGYRSFTRTVRLPATTDFELAAERLLSWQVQLSAGLRVAASHARVEPDAVAVLGLGFGRLALPAPCRVVYVVDEPDRRGFAYGTLPGHPERGEEAFVLERRDGAMTFTVTAFSRPASILAKLGGPIERRVQDAVTGRYLRTFG